MDVDRSDPSRRRLLQGATAAGAGVLAGQAHAADLDWDLPPLRSVTVNGHRLSYYELGKGPPLLLAHGMSGSAAFEWGRVIGPLSRRYRVVAPYQVGFSPSDQPDLPYDAATFVDHLGGMIEALGMERPVIAGESFGGWVVTQYALRQGGRTAWGSPLPPISRLVIVDGAVRVRPRPPTSPPAKEPPSINDPSIGARAFARFSREFAADNSLAKGRVMNGVIVREAVGPEALKRLRVPALLVWGDADQLIPLEDGRSFAAEIPGARLEVIGNCGHIPPVEQPAAFIRAIEGFA